jgi:hypothetical protein
MAISDEQYELAKAHLMKRWPPGAGAALSQMARDILARIPVTDGTHPATAER